MKKIPDKKFDTREIGSLADYEWEETERERTQTSCPYYNVKLS